MSLQKQPWNHKLLAVSIEQALKDIFHSNRHADKVIESYLFQNKKWGSRDRRYFAEATYDIVRNWRYLNFLAGGEGSDVFDILRIYHYLKDQTPTWGTLSASEQSSINHKLKIPVSNAIKESFPDWLDNLAEQELPGTWSNVIKKLNTVAPVDLRANSLKTDAKKLRELLSKESVDVEILSDFTLSLPVRKNVFVTKAFKDGLFEVQDRSSQLVAPFLDVQPGHRVIDACAGAGGKSLHLGSLMKNKGKIIALDINEKKLTELKKRAARNGIDNIETRLIESSKVIKRLQDSADRLLLDVPCSGLGVLRRNPDNKWKLTKEKVEELWQLQRKLLADYSPMLKSGGLMVYSTCSVLPSENQNQIKWFLENFPQFKLITDIKILPGPNKGDGFYMACLQKS
jgi:16S rRNA (cytosine967-C5)-methyltransferase